MTISAAPLEGIVVIIVDSPKSAPRVEKALSQAGAAAFVAHDSAGVAALLERIEPHFAVVDPNEGGAGAGSIARTFFEHESCRLVIYSHRLPAPAGLRLPLLIDKERPVSNVVAAIVDAASDPTWIQKAGDDVKPSF